MLDQELALFKKGCFEPVDSSFIAEGNKALSDLSIVQKKFGKKDMDTLLNELHDSVVGSYLGFSLVNTEKHGFDCKLNSKSDIYLESKVASIGSDSWQATFNDTTYEKALAFKDRKVWLALSVWESASELMCICYGQDERIGDFLKEKIDRFKEGKTVRSTQSISFEKLVFDYKFDILSIDGNTDKVYRKLVLHNSRFKKYSPERIKKLYGFKMPFEKR